MVSQHAIRNEGAYRDYRRTFKGSRGTPSYQVHNNEHETDDSEDRGQQQGTGDGKESVAHDGRCVWAELLLEM